MLAPHFAQAQARPGCTVVMIRQSRVIFVRLRRTIALRHFHSSICSNMRVVPVPVRKDNYAYLLVDDTVNEAAAVDPYTPSKVKAIAEQLGVKVVAGITTHHHNDHSGGNEVRSCLLSFSS